MKRSQTGIKMNVWFCTSSTFEVAVHSEVPRSRESLLSAPTQRNTAWNQLLPEELHLLAGSFDAMDRAFLQTMVGMCVHFFQAWDVVFSMHAHPWQSDVMEGILYERASESS